MTTYQIRKARCANERGLYSIEVRGQRVASLGQGSDRQFYVDRLGDYPRARLVKHV